MKSASRKPQPKRKYFKSRGFSRLFCFSWEQRKLKEIADKVTEKNGNLTVRETFTNSAEYGIISQRDFFDHDISNAENIGGYYVVRNEDFVYNPRISVTAPVGAINRNKLGRNGVMSPLYTVFRTHDIDTEYLEWFFKSDYWHSFMNFNGDSGARSDRFSIKDAVFFEMPIPLPSIDEQRRIGVLLNQINNLITLHQRNSIGYIFKVRAYTNAWEQRKLGDCFDERNESMPDGELISVTINDGIRKFSELGRHDNSNDDKSKYKKVCVGDIAYNSMRMWQGASGYSPYEGIVSPAYTVLSPKTGVVSRCLAYQFKLPEMIHTFQVNSQGITSDNWNLKYPAFSEIDISVATQVKEQELIASFFTNLDNLITLHQRKYFYKLTSAGTTRTFQNTNTWEQRKFGEVFMSLQNNTLSRAELNDEIGAAQNIHYGDVLIKYDEILDVSKEPLSYIEKQSIADKFKTSYLQNGDVIIADTAEDETVGKCTEIEGLTDQKVISGLHTMPVRPNRKFAFGFLGFYLNSAAYHDQLKPLMQGIKVTSISKGAMQDTVVKFPLDLKEQEQIGIYFGGLDHLITLHQRERILHEIQNN